jgi:hypothetical protein
MDVVDGCDARNLLHHIADMISLFTEVPGEAV